MIKVNRITSFVEPICFCSINEEINVRLVSNNGPELYLEDGSFIMFTSTNQYMNFVNNTKIYDPEKKEFDIDKFYNDYYQIGDDLPDIIYKNQVISRVEEFVYMHSTIYRFFVSE